MMNLLKRSSDNRYFITRLTLSLPNFMTYTGRPSPRPTSHRSEYTPWSILTMKRRPISRVGVDSDSTITVLFHKRRLTEDQDLYVREGDFILYGKIYYEIVKLSEPRKLFGQVDHSFEIAGTCRRARRGLFDAT